MRRFAIEGFPYIWVLLVLYAAYYGAILLYSRGLPYVMDGNESFSVLWHSYNLLHFDITKSFGITDEAYGFSSAAHPYLHTHQGNMPRLFGALIYVLGARSIEAQIVVTTSVIGTATVVFAFFTMRRLANPLFAFIFTALLLTDYLQFAQWNVVTYRVWYGFLFFAILLGIMRSGEPRGRWAMIGLFGSFALLFYNELVFAGLMAIIGGLFTFYWHRERLRLALVLWAIEITGAVTALSILLTQLLSKFGLDIVKEDFATTFLMRNLSDNVDLQQAAIDFFNKHGVVFWLNFVDSSSLRNLTHFVRSQTYYIFQLYTPWLVLITAVVLGGVMLSVLIDKPTGAKLLRWTQGFPLFTLAKRRDLLVTKAPALVVLTLVVTLLLLVLPMRTGFGTLEAVLWLATGIAVGQLVSVVASHWNQLGLQKGIVALRNSDFGVVIQVLAVATAAFFFFFRPTSFLPVSWIALATSACVIYLAYGTALHFGPTLQRWMLSLGKLITWPSALLPGLQLKIRLPIVLGMALFLLAIRVAVGPDVFGIKAQAGTFNLSMNRLVGACGATVFLACTLGWALGDQWTRVAKLPALRIGVLITFLLGVVVFIGNQWRLYDHEYSSLWTLPFDHVPGGISLGRLLFLASVMLSGFLIIFGWRRLLFASDAKALVGPLALLVIGETAMLVIFFLSPGYVLNGYLRRAAPFAVFFTSLLIAATFYLTAIIGWRAQAAVRRLARRSGFPASSIASCLATPRLVAGMAASTLFVALSLHWVALQGSYITMLPPNQFAFLSELRKPPFAGKSAVVNTYAAPVAAMTGQWAYFDGISFMNRLYRTDIGYVVEQDMRNYLWLADRDTNPEYRRPDYFICLWPQSLRNAVAERGQGFGSFDNYCPRLPIVAAAAESTGLMRHELVATDASSRGSWAIVKLDHELPPLAQGVIATLLPGKAGLKAKVSYHYVQQDGTPEGVTVVELVGNRTARDCSPGETTEVLAVGGAGDALTVPRDFSGTIALRVTPVSIRKAGEAILSNQYSIHSGARRCGAVHSNSH